MYLKCRTYSTPSSRPNAGCFNRREAASYVAVSTGTFDKLVKLGMMPTAIELFGRRKVWDRASLDEAVDTLAGRTRYNRFRHLGWRRDPRTFRRNSIVSSKNSGPRHGRG